MATEALTALVEATDAVLFDFDGPICDVFAGAPAPEVAKELAGIVARQAPELAHDAEATDDPMEVHRISEAGGEGLLKVVEGALTAAEVAAVAVAGPPVAGAVRSLTAAYSTGRRVAVVSNNSAECVNAFLALHGLVWLVHEVVGRPVLAPSLMKPSPHPLLVAATSLDTDPRSAVLVGDSVTDVQAAKAAGMAVVGFANKPGKRSALTTAGATAVITCMDTLANALTLPGGRVSGASVDH
ncbi:HAD hydrolase-like protein [Streptacidiphilus sp. ASG 303]|uniref:HAD family hydrolase n=1 Tax=Streptacidiphilus sp. ASG 303 TaxID=2896847 RepID=UPI001E572459|nr:HAD family hydrolase [Streptacidiphilus sp. ASG 303]MCD0482035.1 HAD hydrolase-like protein [Streptacidiphilus sp. ASG 303]